MCIVGLPAGVLAGSLTAFRCKATSRQNGKRCRFRTFVIAIMIRPPFLFVLLWVLSIVILHPGYPIKGFAENFLYFVATPIIPAWFFAKLLKRKEPAG
jgi:hypothetical protein